jgi:SH3-like domain-containing protein
MTKSDVTAGLEPVRPDMAFRRLPGRLLRGVFTALVLTAMSCFAGDDAASARDSTLDHKKGSVTGFPLPRFVSLKADRVNVRVGPGLDYAISWVFRRAGLAVEIIGELDNWRQVRDSEGASGWVSAALLSGRRTGIVAPWSEKDAFFTLRSEDSKDSAGMARVERGALVDIVACDGSWCEVYAGKLHGYLEQAELWGVYPKEVIH